MLADEDAALCDELVGGFLLSGLFVPGTGEGDVHSHAGADALGAQVEAGVAGNDLGVGVSADIAHLGLVLGDLAGLDHLIELHARGDAGEVAALIDGGKGVVEVVEALGVRPGAGGVAELDVGELAGGLDHEVLVAEAVGEDDVAAVVGELSGGVVALLALGDVGAQDVLILGQAQGLAGGLGGVDEVEVVGGVLIVQEDETDLDLIERDAGDGGVVLRGLAHGGVVLGSLAHRGVADSGLGLAAGGESEDHHKCKQKRKKLLHFFSSIK